MNFNKNNFKNIVVASIFLAVLIGLNFALATVGGKTILSDFYFNEKEKAVYFIKEDQGGKREEEGETIYQYSLKTRELKKVLFSYLGEEGNYEEKKREIFLHATKSLYPIDLKKNDIGIKLIAIKEEPAVAPWWWEEKDIKHLKIRAIISQDDKEKGEVEFLVCTPGEKVNFDGLLIPGSDTLLFIVTTIGKCFESGYLVQKAFPLSGFEIKDPTALLFEKVIYPEEKVKPTYGGILMKSPLYVDDVNEIEKLIAKIKALMEKIKQLQELIAQLQNLPIKWCHNFNVNLRYGDTGDKVYALHIALEKEGFIISDSEKKDIVFGDHTASAVVGFQEKYKEEVLVPRKLKRGTGYVGPTTRNKLNKLYGCGVVPPPTPICTDLDGGSNIYQKGTTRGYKIGTKQIISKTDYCLDSNQLVEFFCTADSEVNNAAKDCLIGCIDGACLVEPELTEEDVLSLLRDECIINKYNSCVSIKDGCYLKGVENEYRSCILDISKEKDRWVVMITYDGLYDDSIKAERISAIVVHKNKEWIISEIFEEYQCQPGRGHQDFSTELCL